MSPLKPSHLVRVTVRVAVRVKMRVRKRVRMRVTMRGSPLELHVGLGLE